MINEQIKATGELSIILLDKNNIVKQSLQIPNLVVTVGKEFIASRMIDALADVMSHMAVGISNIDLAAANTTLADEIDRVELTSSVRTNNTIRYTATFPPESGTGALTEAGIFNDSSSGTMLCRTTFLVVNKDDEDTLTINWDVTIN